jgi:hypothetical protein
MILLSGVEREASMHRTYYCLGGPFPHSRKKFKEALETRYNGDHEACFNYLNGVEDRFINKGLGLLTFDALLVAICTIQVGAAAGLSLAGVAGVCLSVLSELLIMWAALRVQWPKNPDTLATTERDFTYYVDETANRGIAVNVGLYLAMSATLCVLVRVLCAWWR